MYSKTMTQQFRNTGTPTQLLQRVLVKDIPEKATIERVDYGNDQEKIAVKFPDDTIEFYLDGNTLDHSYIGIDPVFESVPLVVVQGTDVRKVWFDVRDNAYFLSSGRTYKFASYKSVMEALTAHELSLHELARTSYE